MKIGNLVAALEHFAPLSLQDSFDNAGWQIGLTEDADASGALLCLDVTESVIDEAARKGCNLIVSHHPLLFHPLKKITGEDYVQRCVMKAIRMGIGLYAAHTNLDNAPGGVNAVIADRLGLSCCKPLLPNESHEGAGSGLIGELREPMSAAAFLQLVQDRFEVACVRHNAWQDGGVQRVALCGGAGAFLIPNALHAGADTFLTGEVGYHRFFGLTHQLLLIEIGHYESEQYTVGLLARLLREADPLLPIYMTETKTNPIEYKV